MADFKMSYSGIDLMYPARPHSRAMHEGADVTVSDLACSPASTVAAPQSDLTRSVYCILGMPIDAINLATVVKRIEAAAANRAVFLISTPNLNFLVGSLSDPEFRESLLDSDLCSPDGTPIVWIARILGLPIKERAAGADVLDRLRASGTGSRQLTMFLFGGAKGVAAAAARRLNAEPRGLNCIGTMDPGFCDVSEMSQDHIIDAVNSSGADFLSVSLGAKKGQLWLYRNHNRLTIPIRAHLGAAINFQAGTIKRAPPIVRAWGFEWLWRIKEEPFLWKRYLNDGFVLLRLLWTRVLPLAVMTRWHQFQEKHQRQGLLIKTSRDDQSVLISLCGVASERHIPKAIACFQEALTAKQNIIIDLSNTRLIDARFFGLLLMLRKELKSRGAKLIFNGVSRGIERIFRLSELEFLLSPTPPD
jgi:N-acetylglucosaminyldiphosphoundecaprenol N-acetyl-beta-D-mannosaminyltransferase